MSDVLIRRKLLIKLETMVFADGNVEMRLQTTDDPNVLGRQNCRLTEDERLKLLILIEGKLQEIGVENTPVHGSVIANREPASLGNQQPASLGFTPQPEFNVVHPEEEVPAPRPKKKAARKKKKPSPFQGME